MVEPFLIWLGLALVALVVVCAMASAGKREDEAIARMLDDEDLAREELGYEPSSFPLRSRGRRG